MPRRLQTLAASVTLTACGCTLKAEAEGFPGGRSALHDYSRKLKHQLVLLEERHRCPLVTPENPNGDVALAPPADPIAFDPAVTPVPVGDDITARYHPKENPA